MGQGQLSVLTAAEAAEVVLWSGHQYSTKSSAHVQPMLMIMKNYLALGECETGV